MPREWREVLMWAAIGLFASVSVASPLLARSHNRTDCRDRTITYVAAGLRDMSLERQQLDASAREQFLATIRRGREVTVHARSAAVAAEAAVAARRSSLTILFNAGGKPAITAAGTPTVLVPTREQQEAYCDQQWPLLRG